MTSGRSFSHTSCRHMARVRPEQADCPVSLRATDGTLLLQVRAAIRFTRPCNRLTQIRPYSLGLTSYFYVLLPH